MYHKFLCNKLIFIVGLFHQAILMSGSEFATGSMNPPQSHPEDYTKSVAQQNGCPTTDNWTMMECLRTINAKALQQTPIDCKVRIVYANNK